MLAGPHADWQLLALVVALGALLALAPTLRLPVPILLVLGGLVLGFIPGLPRVEPAAGRRARRVPAAAPLLGGLLHLAEGPAHERARDLASSRSAS